MGLAAGAVPADRVDENTDQIEQDERENADNENHDEQFEHPMRLLNTSAACARRFLVGLSSIQFAALFGCPQRIPPFATHPRAALPQHLSSQAQGPIAKNRDAVK
jgi:hypothetical protein